VLLIFQAWAYAVTGIMEESSDNFEEQDEAEKQGKTVLRTQGDLGVGLLKKLSGSSLSVDSTTGGSKGEGEVKKRTKKIA